MERPNTRRLAAGMERLSQSAIFSGRGWALALVFNILFAAVCLLTMVWVNIERMDISYFINLEHGKFREKQELHAKLNVERDRLLSPYELRLKAQKYGMKQPAPGQIRRLDLVPERSSPRR